MISRPTSADQRPVKLCCSLWFSFFVSKNAKDVRRQRGRHYTALSLPVMLDCLRIILYYKRVFKEDGFEMESWIEKFWCSQLNDYTALQFYRYVIKLPEKKQDHILKL